jgi:flagellar basal-body rod protein FlgC
MSMDYSQSFAISAAGMNIERERVNVAALNLANANTVQGVGGVTYRPLRVVAQAQAGDPVARDGGSAFDGMVSAGMATTGQVATSVRIVPADVSPRRVYEPGHPMADERGFVSYAGVDPATEMVNLMSATRAYEANVAAMNTTRTLALRALDIGGQNA